MSDMECMCNPQPDGLRLDIVCPVHDVGGSTSVESVLLAAEATGLTVSWSDCAGCGKPRDEHGPGLVCPR